VRVLLFHIQVKFADVETFHKSADASTWSTLAATPFDTVTVHQQSSKRFLCQRVSGAFAIKL
jgi:hypothetical protein